MDGVLGRTVSSGQRPLVQWCPPPSPFVKINVDASWSKASNSGFAGVVARGADGKFVAAARHSICAKSVAEAEALALLHGCELGVSLGLRSVIFESDSKETISSLSNSLSYGSWEALPPLSRIKRLGEAFQHCRWSWVPRAANEAEHVLASVGITEMCDCVWVVRPPSSLIFVLNNDGLPCPH